MELQIVSEQSFDTSIERIN